VLAAIDPGDRRAGAQGDAGALAGCVQDLMQVAAVDDDVGRAIAGTEVCAEAEVGEFRAVDGIAKDQPTGQHAPGDHLIQQPPPREDPGGVGRELQAGAYLAELCGLLQDGDPVTGPGQGDGVGEAADAATNDDDLGR